MPNPLNNATVPDQYTDAASIQNVFGGRGGTFIVKTQPVFYQLQYGHRGETYFTEEAQIDPGGGSIEAGAIGIRFRNAAAGQVATVSAKIAPPNQPILTLGFSGITGPALVTGVIPPAGNAATAGSGFTYTHTNGTGVYVFTFTTAFTARPIILVSNDGALAFVVYAVDQITINGFRVQVARSNTLAVVDEGFDFLAQAVV